MPFTCQLCHSHAASPIVAKDAKSKQALAISVCQNCGLVQQTEMPDDETLSHYYSHHYRADYKNAYTPQLKHVHRAGLTALNRIHFLKNAVQPAQHPRLLDIGAGGGEFVYVASQQGFQATGIEPNQGYSEYAKSQYGIEIKTMMLADLSPASQDVISLFHVFEHMANPESILAKVWEALSADGRFLIEVPNILQKDASPHNIFFKAHLFYYSRHTLIAAASRYFEVISLEDSGNLMILFKKRAEILDQQQLPSSDEVALIQTRLKQKGWLEYLFAGGGLLKIFTKIKQARLEKTLPKIPPKALLDSLINQQ